MNRKSVMLCINKYLEGGVENALFDAPGRGRNAEITDDEKAWIINIACQKPVNLGYSAEVWTRALLTKHINKFAEEAGHTRLSTISQSVIRTILEEADIKPNKITYYCENRDPDFDQKMHNVLLVYKQLSLQFDEKGQLIPFKEDEQVVHVLSYDENPEFRQLPKQKTSCRMKITRRSAVIMNINVLELFHCLLNRLTNRGALIPLVKDKHSSKEYIEFLKINLKVHSSEETRKYLATKPGRFEFVFTPKHGSWLNLVEGFFSKLTRQMLKGIRVKTKDELVQRIYRYFDEVNEQPVVYHWKYKLEEINSSEEVVVDTLPIQKSS